MNHKTSETISQNQAFHAIISTKKRMSQQSTSRTSTPEALLANLQSRSWGYYCNSLANTILTTSAAFFLTQSYKLPCSSYSQPTFTSYLLNPDHIPSARTNHNVKTKPKIIQSEFSCILNPLLYPKEIPLYRTKLDQKPH